MITVSAALMLAVLPSVGATRLGIVEAGQPVATEVLGPEWVAGDGYLEGVGRNTIAERLLGRCSLGAGDFTVTMRLSILNLGKSAAAVTFGDANYFGFAGGHGKVFVTGAWFDNASGKPIGEPADFFREGQPFDLVIRRSGDQLTITADQKLVYQQTVSAAALGAVGLTAVRSTMRVIEFAVEGHLEPYQAPRPPQPFKDNVVLDPGVEALTGWPHGPFVRLADGGLLALAPKDALISRDEGQSWQPTPIFSADAPFAIRDERAMLRTRDGAIVVIFLNEAVRHYSWDKDKNAPLPDMRLPTYCVRSLDDGRTWGEPILLYDGWCGCIQDIVQHSTGRLIVPGQELLFDAARHATMPYWSDDDGATWHRTRYLDIGGRGDHAGAIEGSLEELRDGRLWLLLRSSDGFFYESFSSDAGVTWTDQVPSKITSTGSPGKLVRLHSGRLLLVWNAIPAPGYERREQLSVAFSEDDGATWSGPRVIATNRGGRVSYSQVFERAPGEIVVTTMQGGLRCVLREADLWVKPLRIVAFGSSTTAPRGTLRVYSDILRDELPAEVINAGAGGDTTERGRARFETDVLAEDPDVVIIQLGINDAAVDVWRDPPATASRVPLDRYRENLEYFVDTLQARGARVVLMTPNRIRWSDQTRERYGKPPYDPADPNGFAVTMPPYVEAVRQVAAARGVTLIDVWAAYQEYDAVEGQSMDDLLLDGMHPNAAGHRLVADRLLTVVRSTE